MTVDRYPQMIAPAGHVEPAPRRVRAFLGGRVVLDTTEARYVWETPKYPQYYVPLADLDAGCLVDEAHARDRLHGTDRRHGLRVGEHARARAAWVYDSGDLAGTVRLEWDAPDAWFEEDEQVDVSVDGERLARPRTHFSR